jgi:hypothetical protein
MAIRQRATIVVRGAAIVAVPDIAGESRAPAVAAQL